MYRARYLRFSFLILVAFLFVACGGGEQQTGGKSGVDKGAAAKQVEAGAYKPQRVAEPCGNDCPYEGDTVTVTVNTAGKEGPISGPLYEVRNEFEAATGAEMEIVELPFAEHFPKLMTDLTSQTGEYDASIAGAWWLGDLVGGDFIVPYDKYYNDSSFPSGTIRMSCPDRANCSPTAATGTWSPTTTTVR
jgi:multiple sugar transport system substrate-binding protein